VSQTQTACGVLLLHGPPCACWPSNCGQLISVYKTISQHLWSRRFRK